MARGSWWPAQFGRRTSFQFGGRHVLIELSVLIVSLRRTELRVLLRGEQEDERRERAKSEKRKDYGRKGGETREGGR